MRILYFTLFILLNSSVSVLAQEKVPATEAKHLLKNSGETGITFSTFYGEIAPSTAFATINDSPGKVFMTEFGIHLNRKFAIGYYLARSGKTNVINVPSPTDPEYQNWIDSGVKLDQLPTGATQAFAYFSHSGLNLAYMHKTERVVFIRGGLKFGSGKLVLTAEKRKLFDFFNTTIFESKVLNFNPEIGVGVNLRSWWRIQADIGYHFVFAGSSQVLDPDKFDGTTFRFGFAFGNFSK